MCPESHVNNFLGYKRQSHHMLNVNGVREMLQNCVQISKLCIYLFIYLHIYIFIYLFCFLAVNRFQSAQLLEEHFMLIETN